MGLKSGKFLRKDGLLGWEVGITNQCPTRRGPSTDASLCSKSNSIRKFGDEQRRIYETEEVDLKESVKCN